MSSSSELRPMHHCQNAVDPTIVKSLANSTGGSQMASSYDQWKWGNGAGRQAGGGERGGRKLAFIQSGHCEACNGDKRGRDRGGFGGTEEDKRGRDRGGKELDLDQVARPSQNRVVPHVAARALPSIGCDSF
eukprot:364440-Chlamydomonas_euryale.AAC.3